ncbi:hypothetical protein Ancab_000509 [Ancistrocladus abbreviatus]
MWGLVIGTGVFKGLAGVMVTGAVEGTIIGVAAGFVGASMREFVARTVTTVGVGVYGGKFVGVGGSNMSCEVVLGLKSGIDKGEKQGRDGGAKEEEGRACRRSGHITPDLAISKSN